MRALEAQLRAGAQALGLALDDLRIARLLDYVDLVAKWNQVYNLTAVREPAAMLTQHLLDSLAVLPPLLRHLDARRAVRGSARATLLDVGSGAGLPGVVLAICCADLQVDCVDSVAKKAAFVRQVALSLQLSNMRGIHARVERLRGPYDLVIARAFASLHDFTGWSEAALAPDGVWLAMKGKHPDQELADLSDAVALFHVEPLCVPGLDAERCLVWMRKKAG